LNEDIPKSTFANTTIATSTKTTGQTTDSDNNNYNIAASNNRAYSSHEDVVQTPKPRNRAPTPSPIEIATNETGSRHTSKGASGYFIPPPHRNGLATDGAATNEAGIPNHLQGCQWKLY